MFLSRLPLSVLLLHCAFPAAGTGSSPGCWCCVPLSRLHSAFPGGARPNRHNTTEGDDARHAQREEPPTQVQDAGVSEPVVEDDPSPHERFWKNLTANLLARERAAEQELLPDRREPEMPAFLKEESGRPYYACPCSGECGFKTEDASAQSAALLRRHLEVLGDKSDCPSKTSRFIPEEQAPGLFHPQVFFTAEEDRNLMKHASAFRREDHGPTLAEEESRSQKILVEAYTEFHEDAADESEEEREQPLPPPVARDIIFHFRLNGRSIEAPRRGAAVLAPREDLLGRSTPGDDSFHEGGKIEESSQRSTGSGGSLVASTVEDSSAASTVEAHSAITEPITGMDAYFALGSVFRQWTHEDVVVDAADQLGTQSIALQTLGRDVDAHIARARDAVYDGAESPADLLKPDWARDTEGIFIL